MTGENYLQFQWNDNNLRNVIYSLVQWMDKLFKCYDDWVSIGTLANVYICNPIFSEIANNIYLKKSSYQNHFLSEVKVFTIS